MLLRCVCSPDGHTSGRVDYYVAVVLYAQLAALVEDVGRPDGLASDSIDHEVAVQLVYAELLFPLRQAKSQSSSGGAYRIRRSGRHRFGWRAARPGESLHRAHDVPFPERDGRAC